MINMYKCERCGTVYSDYSECCNCENTHQEFTNKFAEELAGQKTFKPNEALPASCIMAVEIGKYNEEKGEWEYEYKFGQYELKKIVDGKTAEEFIASKKKREEEDRLWWENYRKEQAAKKAEEEAAKAAEAEEKEAGEDNE